MTDKEIKKEFKIKASKNPDKYYATSVLKEKGFMRKKCKNEKCNIFFWTVNKDQEVCGDPACSGGFRFIGKSLVKEKLDYIGVWKKFAQHFKKLGYTPIKRYPVVARWRDDTDFVQASIYDFQPYVVSGEVTPPANPLVVPQFCLRFNDIDNVGITGAHFTGFVMIGQHAFLPPEEFDKEKYFRDIHSWLREGLGLPNKEIIYHEDAWAGGGNFGPCMEFFSRGLELGNQVYMLYENTISGPKELTLRVLDMGMGHERNAWFAAGTSTSYESVFPTVCKNLYKETGIKVDKNLLKKFLPYASYLNIDEVDDVDKEWDRVAKKVGISTKKLREFILPLSAIYSIGDHTRTLLFALNDGALPSNVGGGYNLRVILRRALSFIEQYGWNIELSKVCEWHADYLKPLFPELKENLAEVSKILQEEKNKFMATRQKSKQIIETLLKKEEKGRKEKQNIDDKKLLELYDSKGISPELIREEAAKIGKEIKIPDNFYARVAELHEKKEQAHTAIKQEKINLKDVPKTKALYFDDWQQLKFKAKVLRSEGKYLVLDQTAFYPTSGGQLHDIGIIKKIPDKDDETTKEKIEKIYGDVVEVFKQGNVIVHEFKFSHNFNVGDDVEGEIELSSRKQLTQHHTATHVINAAAKKVLGKHINQAGAKKTRHKAHIDLTHYKSLTEKEVEEIEKQANKIIAEQITIRKQFYNRDKAEKRFGMNIYQGGAVPGNTLRIVEIPEVDVECCGGTHLNNTAEIEKIKIIKTTKVQDGIIRIIFTAGQAAKQEEKAEKGLAEQLEKELFCENKPKLVPARATELFQKWKKVVKKKKKLDDKEKQLTSTEEFEGDVIAKACEILKTQPEHVLKTVKRFKKELYRK